METKLKNGKSSAKDFVVLWARKYKEATGANYHMTWVSEGSIFRNLMSELTNVQIRNLIDFAFSGHKATKYLRENGYPIRLLPSQLNSFLPHINSSKAFEVEIDNSELHLDIPYWEDQRITYLYRCIERSDINVLIDNIPEEGDHEWKLLMAKIKHQKGYIPEKIRIYYEIWKQKDKIDRIRICKNESKCRTRKLSKKKKMGN